MEINRDLPIKKCEEDLLERGTFAETLAKAIASYYRNESLVVGIFGEWGSGKTSIINMIIEKLGEISDENKQSIVIRFSPWNYSSQNGLINLFFKELLLYIGKNEGQKSEKIIEWILKYMSVLECGVFENSKVGKLSKAIHKIYNAFKKNQTLEDIKSNLIQELNKYDRKIIVIIDDIDRLTKTQVQDVFQLVKQIGDLPNIIYFLPMDREAVISALDKKHVGNGEKYLEKIVQIPFSIPELDKESLRNILDTKVQKIIDDNSQEKQIIDLDYKESIYYNCISLYVKNLRDVNRVLNIFKFRYSIFKNEICVEDILALSIVEALDPRLFKWIYLNKSILCLKDNDNRDTREYRNSKIKELNLKQIEADRALKLVSVLFPNFAVKVEYFYTGKGTWSEARAKMRIANLDRFEMYFTFDLQKLPIKHAELINFLSNYSYNEMHQFIQSKESSDALEYLISEVNARVESLDSKRGFDIAKAFINSGNHLDNKYTSRGVGLMMALDYMLENLLRVLIKLNPPHTLLLQLVRDIDNDCIGLFTSIILRCSMSNEEERRVKDKLIARIENVSENERIFETLRFAIALKFWEAESPNSYQYFVDKVLEDDIKTLKFICAFTSRWNNSNHESGWGFYTENFESIITVEEILNKIEKLRNIIPYNNNKFSDKEKLKLATFYLLYTSDSDDYVSEKTALQLLKKWKEGGFTERNISYSKKD